MSDWRAIDALPESPCMVLYYSSTLMFHDGSGNPVSPLLTAYRDEAFSLGFFDGEAFCHLGSGHDLFEFGPGYPIDDKPTHWMCLPERSNPADASKPTPSTIEPHRGAEG